MFNPLYSGWLHLKRIMSPDSSIDQRLKEAADQFTPKEEVKHILAKGHDGKYAMPNSFKASGTTYIVRPVTDFTIDKQVVFKLLNHIFSLSETPAQTRQAVDETFKVLSSAIIELDPAKRSEKLTQALSMQMSLRDTLFNPEMNTAVYGSCFYICTLFIMPEGVSHTDAWSFELASEWISDWSKECIAANDFFLLASIFCDRSAPILKQNYQTQ